MYHENKWFYVLTYCFKKVLQWRPSVNVFIDCVHIWSRKEDQIPQGRSKSDQRKCEGLRDQDQILLWGRIRPGSDPAFEINMQVWTQCGIWSCILRRPHPAHAWKTRDRLTVVYMCLCERGFRASRPGWPMLITFGERFRCQMRDQCRIRIQCERGTGSDPPWPQDLILLAGSSVNTVKYVDACCLEVICVYNLTMVQLLHAKLYFSPFH